MYDFSEDSKLQASAISLLAYISRSVEGSNERS